ncbi:MAG: galactokinase [Deltaproteobacteria bacterium]|nr:galactokinase [Deltaproteobacteria bacterium]
MILASSPLRVTLGGGGTDLPSYYERHGGFLIAAAIDKYVTVAVTRPFSPGIVLRHARVEHVHDASEVQHPIIREALLMLGMQSPQVEITSLSDIPSGTGLGSSGSFTTALLKALRAMHRDTIHCRDLAEMACDIEMNRLKEPVGKQDPYIAAYGGLRCFHFRKDGTVDVEPLRITTETLTALEDNLLLFFTGQTRPASEILQDQDARTRKEDGEVLENLHTVRDIGLRSQAALERGDLDAFGRLLNDHWEYKRRRAPSATNPQIDAWYKLARDNGAIGGKIVGAGGGGFLMFYTEDRTRLRLALRETGLQELRFRFDFEGTKVLLS